MVVRQLIPEGLAQVAPGPELAGLLAELKLSQLSGYDCVEVLKARYRQFNHERARLMATMVEVGLCGIGPDDELPRTAVPDEFAADEIRAALMLTRRAADAQFWLAHDLMTRLPAVHATMDAGVLDEPRARVFSEWTTGLVPEAARAVCAQLLPRAPGWTTGQLIEQIKKLAIAVDPDWARRRYEQALADRKVVGYRNADGSANLSGVNLPVDRVAAACRTHRCAGQNRQTHWGPSPDRSHPGGSVPRDDRWNLRRPGRCGDHQPAARSETPRRVRGHGWRSAQRRWRRPPW